MPTGVKHISSGGRGDDHYRGPICSGIQTVADSSSMRRVHTPACYIYVESLPLICLSSC